MSFVVPPVVHHQGSSIMKKSLSLLALSLVLGTAHLCAQAATCDEQATEKKLAGAAKTSFLKKCNADAGAANGCDAKAAEKKLAGAAKNSFLKKCNADAAGGAAPAAAEAKPDPAVACEAKAAEKKLAGAAKNSFVKKCAADAAKG